MSIQHLPNLVNYSQERLDRQKLAVKFNSSRHFMYRGKIYDRQVEHDGRECELRHFNGMGEAIIVYRGDESDDWYCVKFESLRVLEVK